MLTWEAKKEAIFEMPVRAKRYRSSARRRSNRIDDLIFASVGIHKAARCSRDVTTIIILTILFRVCFKSTDWWRRHHAQGPKLVEARAQGAVPRAFEQLPRQDEARRLHLPRLPVR